MSYASVLDPTPDGRYSNWIDREIDWTPGASEIKRIRDILTIWMYMESAQEFPSLDGKNLSQLVIRINHFINKNWGEYNLSSDDKIILKAQVFYRSFINRFLSSKVPEKYLPWVYHVGLYAGVSFDEVERLVLDWSLYFPDENISKFSLDEVRAKLKNLGDDKMTESMLNKLTEAVDKGISPEKLQEIAKSLGIELKEDAISEMLMGMEVELEHGSMLGDVVNVTDDDEVKTFQIALAHVMEIPDYYTRLAQMEEEGKAYWAEQDGESEEGVSEPEEEDSEDVEVEDVDEESVEEAKQWEAPTGLMKKNTNDIVSAVIEGAKNLDEVMSRLSSIHADDKKSEISSQELGKINRVRNIVKHTFGESVELTEKVRAKFESGIYYFEVRCKNEAEFKNILKQFEKSKNVTVHSTYPPQNMIKVKVDGPSHTQARTFVKDIVQRFNGVTVESRIHRNF